MSVSTSVESQTTWTCNICTYSNALTNALCEACGTSCDSHSIYDQVENRKSSSSRFASHRYLDLEWQSQAMTSPSAHRRGTQKSHSFVSRNDYLQHRTPSQHAYISGSSSTSIASASARSSGTNSALGLGEVLGDIAEIRKPVGIDLHGMGLGRSSTSAAASPPPLPPEQPDEQRAPFIRIDTWHGSPSWSFAKHNRNATDSIMVLQSSPAINARQALLSVDQDASSPNHDHRSGGLQVHWMCSECTYCNDSTDQFCVLCLGRRERNASIGGFFHVDEEKNMYTPDIAEFQRCLESIVENNTDPMVPLRALRKITSRVSEKLPRYRILDTRSKSMKHKLMPYIGALDFLEVLNYRFDSSRVYLKCKQHPSVEILNQVIRLIDEYIIQCNSGCHAIGGSAPPPPLVLDRPPPPPPGPPPPSLTPSPGRPNPGRRLPQHDQMKLQHVNTHPNEQQQHSRPMNGTKKLELVLSDTTPPLPTPLHIAADDDIDYGNIPPPNGNYHYNAGLPNNGLPPGVPNGGMGNEYYSTFSGGEIFLTMPPLPNSPPPPPPGPPPLQDGPHSTGAAVPTGVTTIPGAYHNRMDTTLQHSGEDSVIPPEKEQFTLTQLVALITHEYYQDSPTSTDVLLLCYPIFSDGSGLLECIRQRFFTALPSDNNSDQSQWINSVQRPIQFKCISFICQWLRQYYELDFIDNPTLLSKIHLFSREIAHYSLKVDTKWVVELSSKLKETLQKLSPHKERNKSDSESESKSAEFESKRDHISNTEPDDSDLNKGGKLLLTEYSPSSIADEITLEDTQFFMTLHPRECLFKLLKPKQASVLSPNLTAMIKRFNSLHRFVILTILSSQSLVVRCKLIQAMISTAEHLFKNCDFHALLAFYSALDSTAVRRLKIAWMRVDTKYKVKLRDLGTICDERDNFSTLRKLLRHNRKNQTVIPYIGMLLKDLTFVNERTKITKILSTKKHKSAINNSESMSVAAAECEAKERETATNLKIQTIEWLTFQTFWSHCTQRYGITLSNANGLSDISLNPIEMINYDWTNDRVNYNRRNAATENLTSPRVSKPTKKNRQLALYLNRDMTIYDKIDDKNVKLLVTQANENDFKQATKSERRAYQSQLNKNKPRRNGNKKKAKRASQKHTKKKSGPQLFRRFRK